MARQRKRDREEDINLLNDSSPFQITEAYKTLRTNLIFSLAANKSETNDHKAKIIVITSSIPSEGKSTTCANLSIAMAQKSEKVLIIDADLRKPVQNKLFEIDNSRGLSDVLIDECVLENTISKNVRPFLDLLSSGTIAPNPSELLGSKAMEQMLKTLSEKYDYIFIDSPPINIVSDALVASVNATGIVMVVRPEICTHEHFKHATESIKLANIKLLGVVMSNVKEDNLGFKYKRKYYSYRKYKN
ncbi:Tyrosine-protein kinase YwqD [bioreactor metagenome]|uniref:non-specific protein-tyrosine kinase n=1 Tax=bioreactor metagenome TaxID=1076179 RepID=A0A645BY58_9ZZZZ|nr:CpsD/CapB family tyrosine-protein kinase [Oscillospiraceae bacterium]